MTTTAPLAGHRVIEIGSSVAAPYAAWILAELGAEVIKVEPPGRGDDARHWGPPFWEGIGAMFRAYNRNKKSVVVDMRSEAERQRLRRLIVETADVVLQNMRPGKTASLSLGGAELVSEKPGLVYCNMGAFGRVGPYAERPGYDPLMQACAGLMSVTGREGEAPVRIGTSIIDMGTALWSVIGILAALKERDATGKGGVVDASLYETAVAWMTSHSAYYHASGKVPGKMGSGIRSIVPYQAYACSDGYLVVAAGNDDLFAKLAAALEHPEWAEDKRFLTNPDRVTNREALNALLEPLLKQHPRHHWQDLLDKAGVPNAPTLAMDEVAAHPQTQALDLIQATADGKFQLIGVPLSFDGARPALRTPGPELGEHNREVFGEES